MKSDTLKVLIREAIEEIKGRDIIELDVRPLTEIADTMFIVTGTSQRHVKSIANTVVEHSKEAGVCPVGVEGEAQAEWVLVDLGDVIVHAMLEETRQFYNLERLWCFEEKDEGVRED